MTEPEPIPGIHYRDDDEVVAKVPVTRPAARMNRHGHAPTHRGLKTVVLVILWAFSLYMGARANHGVYGAQYWNGQIWALSVGALWFFLGFWWRSS